MDRPFAVGLAVARELTALEIHQHEVAPVHHLAQRDAGALHPEAAPVGIAQRHVADHPVAMALELQHPARAGKLVEVRRQRVADRRHGDIASVLGAR